MSSEATFDENYVYAMPKGLQVILMAISLIWVRINEVPVAPLGLLIVVIVIAQKYDFTYFGSLRKGWRMLGLCAAIAAFEFARHAHEIGLFR